MFPGLVTAARGPQIEAGLPNLNDAMRAAGIDTPRRIAGFLTTLRFESWVIHDTRQITQTRTYYGRGYIQLTGRATDPTPDGFVQNYTPAGLYLGIDLAGNPDLALDIRYSPLIATWYWTVARPDCNADCDNLDFGLVCRAIGYPLVVNPDTGKSNDDARCEAFAYALAYLTGEPTPPVDCRRVH